MQVTGRVSAIIPRADPQASTFKMKVRIPNSNGRIEEGMLTQLLLLEGSAYQATIVPKDAVVTKGPQKLVYVMNGNNMVTKLPVQTGSGVGAWIEGQGALKAGQKVVTRGNERQRRQAVTNRTGSPVELPAGSGNHVFADGVLV